MRRAVFSCVLLGALASLWLPTSAQGPARAVQTVDGRPAAAREALVKFRRPPRVTDLAALGGDVDAEAIAPVGRTGVYRVRSRSVDAATLVSRLARLGAIQYAEPNYIIRLDAAPNDPDFPQLWGLENLGQLVSGIPGTPGADIGATSAWDVSTGSANTVVAVIDTGVDYTHEDLAANMWSAPAPFTVNLGGPPVTCPAGTHGFNAITRTCDPMDDHSHGTHVAGTIGAVGNNNRGVTGVNWTTRIMGIKFLDAGGSGTTADAISSIRFAIEARQAFAASMGANVRVISASWGGGPFSQSLFDEINAANQADMLFVAAAGNSGIDNDILPHYPSGYAADNVISVAATTNTDQRAWFSNYGSSSVHLGAPGADILSTMPGNTYAMASGTSMATPHVSGAAALVLSVCSFDTAALKDALIGTVTGVPALASLTITGGRLNVHSAIHACLAPPPPPQNLAAAAGDARVTLTWSAALGATRYIVKRGSTAGGPYTTLSANVKGAMYVDSSVVNDTTYYYVVAAANSLGESGDSNEASATPSAPSDLGISALQTPPPSGAGTTFSVTVTTRNTGNGTAPPTTTALFLSTNAIYGATDTRLTDLAVGALAPGASSSATATVTIPTDTTVGTYYLIAVADADTEASESIELNNGLARLLRIGPDLEISALGVPSSGTAGGTIDATSTVVNEGGGNAAAFSVTFYLSANTTLDASDILLSGSRSLASLAGGATSAGSTSLTIPAHTAVGSYQVIAKADGLDQVAETIETNNATARPIQIGGDLVVTSFSAPSTAGAGTVISVTETTTNQGTGAIAASSTRFFLSANFSYDASDVQLGGFHAVPLLAPSAASTATVSLTVPGATAPGQYYLLAVADADGAAPETSETNNTSFRSLQVGTDLTVSALTVPANSGAGLTISVSETTRNQGTGVAAATITRFYLSPNTTIDATDWVLSPDHTVPELTAGATHAITAALSIPTDVPAGPYYVIAKADAANVVVETQELNNTLSRSIQIGGDLVVSAFSAPTKAGAGRSIVVGDTVVNQGVGIVAPSSTRFFLSVNALFDANDTLLAAGRAVPQLASGASSGGSTTVEIPASTATGSYYLFAKADGDNVIAEGLETNNTSLRSLQVGPDLTVSSLSVPSKGGAGLPVVVTSTVTNQGGGDAGASIVMFYLSPDWMLDVSDPVLDGTRSVPALANGATSSGSTTLTIPANTPAGTYYLLAKADAGSAVTETVETNNSMSRTIQIGPDLRVSAFAAPASVASGGSVSVTDTALNQGGAPAGASTTRYFLSANLTLDAGDVYLAERAVPGLAVNQSHSAATVLQVPAGTAAGSYYLLAQADGAGAVGESLETNNVTPEAIQVTMVP